MNFASKLPLFFLSSALPLTSVSASEFPEFDRYIPVAEQRSAMIECKIEIGKRGLPKFEATYIEGGGQTRLRILPYGSVNSEDAAWINACAAEKLGINAQPTPSRNRNSAGRCSESSPFMVGGSAYCIGN